MKLLIASLAILVVLSPLRVHAALGGNAASVQADQAQMKGSLRQKQTAAYTVQEIQAASGTVVREYVSSTGNVFAVAWQGQFAPNLQQLLGAYFEQYSEGVHAAKASYVGRRPLDLHLSGLVVQLNGHMRAFHGRAYLSEQIPAGAKEEELW